MKLTISTTNAKLGYQIPSVSLTPACSCRKDAPCAKLCYAKKGTFLYSNVKASHAGNYNLYISDSNAYFNEIIAYLKRPLLTYKYFRWHVAGDIVDENYFLGMIKTAKNCKDTKFLCFTKKFNIINDYINNGGKIPSNLKVVFSAWNKHFKVENPYNFPVAYVLFKNNDLNPKIPPLSIPCSGQCENCLACWSLKKGQSIVFEQH